MGLDQVIGEVRRDGEERAQAILENARKEAQKILDSARAEAKRYEDGRLAQAAKDAQQVATQAGSRAESDARKAILGAEAQMREAFKAAVLAGLAGLPAKSRQAHLKSLAEKAAKVIPKGKLYCAEKDADAATKLKGYTHAGNLPIAGGIVVESDAGDARLDLSYETMLEDVWRDVLKAEAGLFQ